MLGSGEFAMLLLRCCLLLMLWLLMLLLLRQALLLLPLPFVVASVAAGWPAVLPTDHE